MVQLENRSLNVNWTFFNEIFFVMGNIFGKRRSRSRSVSASDNLSNGHYGGGGIESNFFKSVNDIHSVSTTKKLVSPFVYQRLRFTVLKNFLAELC